LIYPAAVAAIASIPTDRDIYANLLRDTRGMRRDQAVARDGWFTGLPWDKKEDTLFELEMLLKGVACFGNPRNHPGEQRSSAAVAHDFTEELRVLRDGIARINTLVRVMLGDREKAYTFTRYLETVLPEDSARGRLVQEQLTQDTPEESLFVLRNSFGAFQELSDAILRLGIVSNRIYGALHGTVAREVGRNVYFNPLIALEFRQEFDRIQNGDVLEALNAVPSEGAHRVAALAMLALFRLLRYLELIDGYAVDPASARRAYLILSVVRSDVRALTRYLGRHAADVLANALERELMSVRISDLASRRADLEQEARWLAVLRSAFETIASGLRVDVRKVFLHDVPSPSAGMPGADLAPHLTNATRELRASLHHAITALTRALAPSRSAPQLAMDRDARRAASERLRREVWMFMQILRAFMAKASASSGASPQWASGASYQFARDFLVHFRAIGYQLMRSHEYPRTEAFLASIEPLRDVDLLSAAQLAHAVEQARHFYAFLEQLFRSVSARAELAEIEFDRKDGVETLKIYLGKA
jgi:hypothetical protein